MAVNTRDITVGPLPILAKLSNFAELFPKKGRKIDRRVGLLQSIGGGFIGIHSFTTE